MSIQIYIMRSKEVLVRLYNKIKYSIFRNDSQLCGFVVRKFRKQDNEKCK